MSQLETKVVWNSHRFATLTSTSTSTTTGLRIFFSCKPTQHCNTELTAPKYSSLATETSVSSLCKSREVWFQWTKLLFQSRSCAIRRRQTPLPLFVVGYLDITIFWKSAFVSCLPSWVWTLDSVWALVPASLNKCLEDMRGQLIVLKDTPPPTSLTASRGDEIKMVSVWIEARCQLVDVD